jgi:hypothetical protein
MNGTAESGSKGKWETASRERGCYCGLWDKNPAFYEKQGLPPGFCGICIRCGVPGHTRHFPGPVPFTGAWCDKCYRLLKWTWPFRSIFGWIYVLVVLGIVWAIAGPLLAGIMRALS